MPELPSTLGALKSSKFGERHRNDPKLGERTVKSELRENLICKLQRGEDLFPGVVGYEDTVVPQIVNAVLSRHNFILLGLRGQAKTRIIRMLTGFWMSICLTSRAARSATIRFIPSAAAAAI